MTTLRENPNDGLLDVLHADSDTWIRAVALLQVAGGLNVSLIPGQLSVFQQILTNSNLLGQMSNRVENVAVAAGDTELNTRLLHEKLVSDTNPMLASTLNQLTEMGLQDVQLFNKVQEILAFMNSSQNYTTRLQNMEGQLDSVTFQLSAVESAIQDLLIAIQNLTTQEQASRATTPTFKQVALTNANTEYSVVIDATTRILRLRCRPVVGTGATTRIRYSWSPSEVTNTVSGNFSTLTGTEVLELQNVRLAGTLYLAAEAGSNIAEVEIYR